MGVYVGGLISGANTEDLITKIMQYENLRLTSKQSQQSQLEKKQSAWRDVRSSLNTLSSKLDTLRLPFAYRARKATLTDETVATFTPSSGAALTTHTLSVTTLAQSHVLSHHDAMAQASANDALGITGSFQIGLGTTLQQIDVTATDTLNSVADKINAAKTGVGAAVVKVNIGGVDKYRMVLTSSKSGLDNQIVMNDVVGSEGTLVNLGFKDGTGAWTKELSTAQNAVFTLDGVDYQRSSNVVDDVVPGLSITLKKQGAGATTQATIGLDADKVLESVKAWVDAVNSTQDLLAKQSSYNAETKEAGVLNGESLVRNLQRAIRSSISNVVSGLPTDLNEMYDVGIATGAYGTANYGKVVIDEAKFKAALEKDAEGVAKLFGAVQNNVALPANGGSVALDGTSGTAAGFDLNDVINGVTDPDRFGTAGGGWQSDAAPSVASPQGFVINLGAAKTIDEITIYQPSPDATPANTHGLKNFTLEYWDGATSSWQALKTVTDYTGGSIDSIDFTPVTTDKVRFSVTETYSNYNVRISEFQVAEYNNGAVIDMYRYVRDTLDVETGALDTRDETLTKQISQVKDQIDRVEEQLAAREERLREQFAAMEEAIAKMQTMGSALTQQLAALQS